MAKYQIVGVTHAVYDVWDHRTIIVVDADDEVDAACQVLFKAYVMGAEPLTRQQIANVQWSQPDLPAWYPFKPTQVRQIADHFEPHLKARRT